MPKEKVQSLPRWFSFLALILLSSLTLPCCGRVTQSEDDQLKVTLVLPQGEDAGLFWFGVQKKVVRWKAAGGETKEMEWAEGGKMDWALREGDRLEFLGTDAQGRLLVNGETEIGEEKKAAIPLRRVL